MWPLFDALWRAAAYCLHRRVILWSFAPLVLMLALTLIPAYFFWEPAMDAMRALLEEWELLTVLNDWLAGVGLSGLKMFLAPFLVLCLATPLVVVLCLLSVAVIMTQVILRLVAERRFPTLERRHGGSFMGSLGWGLLSTLMALALFVVSVPLWFVPPLVLVLPPLIWGWLAYRLMSYDVLAEHASADERRELMRRHRVALLGIGVTTGYLSAAPSLVWASGMVFVVLAPWLIPVAIWIYTLVFAFSALWFAHYLLGALAALRLQRQSEIPDPIAAPSQALLQADTADAALSPEPLSRLPPL